MPTGVDNVQRLYNLGVPIVVGFLLFVPVVIAVVDIALELRNQPPIGYYVQDWSSHSPWLAAILLGVLFALLGHFFMHPTVYSPNPYS